MSNKLPDWLGDVAVRQHVVGQLQDYLIYAERLREISELNLMLQRAGEPLEEPGFTRPPRLIRRWAEGDHELQAAIDSVREAFVKFPCLAVVEIAKQYGDARGLVAGLLRRLDAADSLLAALQQREDELFNAKWGNLPGQPGTVAGEGGHASRGATKRRHSTEHGEAFGLIISALSKHHQYGTASGLNTEPIEVRALAKQVKVSPSRTSNFFRDKFRRHRTYKVMCRDRSMLQSSLKMLNQDYAPHTLHRASSLGDSDDLKA